MVRISVYSDHPVIFWKSVQDAFEHAGLPLLRGYAFPDDAAGASLLADDLCHGLAGRGSVYIFIDDFHLLTDGASRRFLCTARQPPAGERAPDRGEPRPLPPRRRRRAAGQPGLSDRGRASAAQPHGAVHLRAPLRYGPDRCAGRNAAACERGVVFGRISEPAHAFRARRAAGPALGHLHHVFRRHDRAALAPAAGVSGRHGTGG